MLANLTRLDFCSTSQCETIYSRSSVGYGGFRQGPAVSCTDSKKKILCLPKEYSKFDLPYRNDFNVIDIGKCSKLFSVSFLYVCWNYVRARCLYEMYPFFGRSK